MIKKLWDKLTTLDILVLIGTVSTFILFCASMGGWSAYWFAIFSSGIGWLLNTYLRIPKK